MTPVIMELSSPLGAGHFVSLSEPIEDRHVIENVCERHIFELCIEACYDFN